MRTAMIALMLLLSVVAATAELSEPEYVSDLDKVHDTKEWIVDSADITHNNFDESQQQRDQETREDERLIQGTSDAPDQRFRERKSSSPTPIVKDAQDEERFTQTDARQRRVGFLKSMVKSGINMVKSGFKALTGAGKSKARPEDIEDCVGCRFAWLQVENMVGNSQIEETIYDAFTQTCVDMQKAAIFYPACEDMFDDVYGMIGDYMDGYTVNQMCEAARMCR